MKLFRRLRDFPGVLVRDLPRYRRALARSGLGDRSAADGWISLCNRIERLHPGPEGKGMECDWKWGSELHAPKVLPELGREIMSAALAEWPVQFAREPLVLSETPKVSFVFAHAGEERLPQLRQTIQSIYAQAGVPCECIVVDQTPTPLLDRLPMPVVYRHLAKDGVAPGWHKSWAYNVGAKLARGSIVVFHDGDICAPEGYAAELVSTLASGQYDAASLQRFLFYLDARDSGRVNSADLVLPGTTPTAVLQNWKGGTIAVTREAFASIGGFDEGFVDWGGEDDEFFDRCASLAHCRSGYLPFVHLWHTPQADRRLETNANISTVLPWRLSLGREQRAIELRNRGYGSVRGPDPAVAYKAIPGA